MYPITQSDHHNEVRGFFESLTSKNCTRDLSSFCEKPYNEHIAVCSKLDPAEVCHSGETTGRSAARIFRDQFIAHPSKQLPAGECPASFTRECIANVETWCKSKFLLSRVCDESGRTVCERNPVEACVRQAIHSSQEKIAEVAAQSVPANCSDAVYNSCTADLQGNYVDVGTSLCKEMANNTCAAEAAIFSGIGKALWSALPAIGSAVVLEVADRSLYSWLSKYTSKSQDSERRVLWAVSKAVVVTGLAGATQLAAWGTGQNCGYGVMQAAQLLITSQVSCYVLQQAWSYLPQMPWTRTEALAQ